MTVASMVIQVRARVRNQALVTMGIKALARIARWLKPETVEQWTNRLLRMYRVEVRIANGKWQRVSGVQLKAEVKDEPPLDGWRCFSHTGRKTVTLDVAVRCTAEESTHACQCPNCHPEIFSSAGRQGTDHIGVQYPDERFDHKAHGIFLDGVDVSAQCSEALLGENGWAIVYNREQGQGVKVAHRCRNCGTGACQSVVHGRVEVRPKVSAGEAPDALMQ